MPTLSPVASGVFQINYNGVSYTRTTTGTPTVKEKTGDDDTIANFVFNLSTIDGTIASATLNWGVGSLVAGTGAVNVRISAGGVVGADDEELFTGAHIASPIAYATSVVDSVGAKVSPLNGTAVTALQVVADANQDIGICLDFAPGASAHEEIVLSAGPTLEITMEDESEDPETTGSRPWSYQRNSNGSRPWCSGTTPSRPETGALGAARE